MSDALRSDDVCRDITDDDCCSCVCDECGERYRDWAQHVRRSPDCVPPELVENSSEDEDEEPLPPPLRHADEEKQSGFSSRPSVELAARIALDLATFRNEFGLSGPNVKLLKEKVQGWFDHDRSEFCGGLQPFLREGISSNDIKQAAERDIFAGLSSEKQEIARVKEIAPYVEPREVKLSDERGDTVVSFRVADLVERKLQRDSKFRRRVLERSAYYKSGVDFRTSPTKLENVDSCAKARYHPKLMRPAAPGEEHHIRMTGIFNCDDIEVRRSLSPHDMLAVRRASRLPARVAAPCATPCTLLRFHSLRAPVPGAAPLSHCTCRCIHDAST